MYYIYILFSPAFDKYYVGYTKGFIKRFNEHNHQEYYDTYTSKYRPWQPVAVFECGFDKSVAIKTENFIKKQKSRKFIEQLIADEFIPNDNLSHLKKIKHP